MQVLNDRLLATTDVVGKLELPQLRVVSFLAERKKNQALIPLSQSRTSGKLTNKFRHFINLHKEREREREFDTRLGTRRWAGPPP